ncbi:MAG: ribbon-helix-helix domain-containing protein [Hyphomicrobiales bacterium]|nr:ribbon-helix-helix domain-containing protein [Hyphomicrobiales bacterium]
MRTTVTKRSIQVGGHKTSISLEDAFWNDLKEIAALRARTLSELVAEIDTERKEGTNLSSAIRTFVLEFYLNRVAEVRGLQHPSNIPIAPE